MIFLGCDDSDVIADVQVVIEYRDNSEEDETDVNVTAVDLDNFICPGGVIFASDVTIGFDNIDPILSDDDNNFIRANGNNVFVDENVFINLDVVAVISDVDNEGCAVVIPQEDVIVSDVICVDNDFIDEQFV